MQCSHCHGRGRERCTWCNGNGYRQVGENREHCTSCNGMGTTQCHHCNGDGMTKCQPCAGSGRIVKYVNVGKKEKRMKDSFVWSSSIM